MRKVLTIIVAVGLMLSLVPAVASADPGTLLYVDQVGGTPDTYSTIQEAIDAASADYTIQVKYGNDGTYEEDLEIDATKSNLVLEPYNDDQVTIKGIAQANAFPLAAPNIEILADGVSISGFTIEGHAPTEGYYSSGIVIGAMNVEICDNTFIIPNASSLADISQAIQTYHDYAMPGVDISGLNIHDNTFTDSGPVSTPAGYEGIYINRDAATTEVYVTDNVFTGDIVRAITTERSKTSISGNIIVTDLTPDLPGGYEGICVRDYYGADQSEVEVIGNTVMGSDEGLGFMTGIRIGTSGELLSDIVVKCNTIERNTVGIKVHSSAEGVVINCNNIMNNTTYGVQNTDDAELDAEKNWWGDVSGPYHPTNNPSAMGDEVSDNVDYDPWALTPDPCEPKTQGFWKNHEESLEAVLTLGSVELGTYSVPNFTTAEGVFDNSKAKCAEDKLAAQLLAAELNALHLAHLGEYGGCVEGYIAVADDALDNYTSYNGPDDTCTVKKGGLKGLFMAVADVLDEFNNGEMCGCACEWD